MSCTKKKASLGKDHCPYHRRPSAYTLICVSGRKLKEASKLNLRKILLLRPQTRIVDSKITTKWCMHATPW
jgi:hypothetical protein